MNSNSYVRKIISYLLLFYVIINWKDRNGVTMIQIVIANIVNFIAGLCSLLSVSGKTKKKIVRIEFVGSILRIISNVLVRSWSDAIAKVIKGVAQGLCLGRKLNKRKFYVISFLYVVLCIFITYMSKDIRCLVAIVPSVLEFYSLLVRSTKKYRLYIIVTKVFWTINNLIFKLYVGIIFDVIIMIGHYLKVRKVRR